MTDAEMEELRGLSARYADAGIGFAAEEKLLASVPRLIAALESARRERDASRWADATRRKVCEALALENSRLVAVNIGLASAEQTVAQVEAERDAARAEAEQLRSAQGTVVVDGLTYGEHMTRDLRAQLAQRDRDWDALVKLIAVSVGTEEDRDCAENDETAEFDPWHALRTRAAEAEQLRAERDAAVSDLDEAKAWRQQLRDAVVRETADAAADWLDEKAAEWDASKLPGNDAAMIRLCAKDVRNMNWRTTKGDAGK